MGKQEQGTLHCVDVTPKRDVLGLGAVTLPPGDEPARLPLDWKGSEELDEVLQRLNAQRERRRKRREAKEERERARKTGRGKSSRSNHAAP